MRATLEIGFQCLSPKDVRPAVINDVFKISLYHHTLYQLRNRFSILLSRTVDEELDMWDAPFIHLGGAGTYYPRRDALGNIVPIQNGWTVRQVGPLEKRMARLVHVDDGRWDDMDIDLSGFEGEWFDPYDVQGYIEEHYACKLDPRSTYFECFIDEEEDDETASQSDSSTRQTWGETYGSPSLTHSPTSSPTSDASSVSITPPTHAFNLPDASFNLDMNFNHAPTSNYPAYNPKLMNNDVSYDQNLRLDLAPWFDYGVLFATGGWGTDMQLGPALMAEKLKVAARKRKKRVWVDMNALVKGKSVMGAVKEPTY